MDKSIVPMEESHRRSDSAASAAKSVGSLVQINSIAIDLSSAVEEIESSAHEHFSIRGFVSEMRKKDLKSCSLFASECNLLDSLPTLYVPKFRWWHCSNCIPEIAAERTTLEMVLADRSLAGTSSCKNVDGGDGVFSYNRKKTGNKNGPRDYGDNHEDNDPSNNIMNSNPRRAEGQKTATCSKDKIDVRTKEGGNLCASITEADPLQVQEIDANSADAYDEPYCAASGSNGAFSTVPHRRKPKLRSLADIMGEERNLRNEHQRTRSASSNGLQVTSTGMEAILAPMPQVDIPSDVSRGGRSPSRKRKIALEEDKESLEMKYPNGTTKGFRGLMLDGVSNHIRVETSDSESGGDASTRLSFQLALKAQRIKAQKGKALDMNKKTRPVVIDNASMKIQEAPKTYAANFANSLKDVAAETSMYKPGHVPSTFVEVGPYVRSFLPAQLMETNSDPSNSKNPEVEADHNNPFTPPGKSILGECNIKAKVALDLSLNSFIDSERNSNNQSSFRQHRGIPDLNESFGQKTDMMQGKKLQNLFDERSLPLHNTLDISTFLNKETATEGKKQWGVYESPTVQSVDNNIELRGASDEMEIIELLAKNKRDRELGNLRKHITSVGVNSSIRGSPPLYADGCHRMINFPPSNARTGVAVASGNICVGLSIPVSFPHLNQCQMDMSKLDESQFKLVSPFTTSQQRKQQYLTSSSIIAGPRPREVPDLLWPSRRENVPFHHVPPSSMTYSFSDQCHKGKTISDIKGGEGRIGSSSKSVGSLDPYSNDAIPAMQLLSLMNQGIMPGSSIEVSQKHFLDKPFSPCNHHPRRNGNENQKFLGGSIFSQNSQKTLQNGVYCPGESSKKASSYKQVGQVPSEPKNSKAIFSGRATDLVAQPSKSNPALSICVLNRNPADFSIPDSRNEYTISAKDLKRRNLNASKERSRTVNLEGKKRPRVRKNGFAKENSKK